jgi:hypothetical protein
MGEEPQSSRLIMNRIVIRLLGFAPFMVASVVHSYADDAGTEKPIVMEKFEVSASALDLNPDRDIDTVNPRKRLIIYDLGAKVPASAIITCFTCEELEATYRPVYNSIDEFAEGVRHEGWAVKEKRDLANFYVVVMATPSGHLVGVYYAKTKNGRRLQDSNKIELFVADEHLNQIVPDSNVFSLDQRIRYLVSTSVVGAAGLVPMYSPTEAGTVPMHLGSAAHGSMVGAEQSSMGNAAGLSSRHGAMVFHEGELFLISNRIHSFQFVFKAGPDSADAVTIAFTDWPKNGDDSPEGFERVHITRQPAH